MHSKEVNCEENKGEAVLRVIEEEESRDHCVAFPQETVTERESL